MATTKKNKAAKQHAATTKNTAKAAQATSAKAANKTAAAAEAITAKAAHNLSAIESKAITADHMVHAGNEAVKDFVAAGSEEAQKAQAKALEISKEAVEQWTESTDKSIRSFTEAFALDKEQAEALSESSKLVSELGRELHEEFMSDINALFSENVELGKDLLACRTLNDVMEVQGRVLQNHMAHFINQSERMSNAWFKISTEITEPLNTQAKAFNTRLNKTLAA